MRLRLDKPNGSRKNFATTASEQTVRKPSIAFEKPCLYCNGLHTLDSCKNITKNLLKDRYAFLQTKGLCFACLKSGHIKGSCRNKLSCKQCGKCHPSILHLEVPPKNDGAPLPSEAVREPPAQATSSATHMGAGDETQQALPIVPVRLKSKYSDKYIETYAFLDSGSTATFCSEKVVNSLNVEGRKAKISLLTMGQEKVQNTYIISGLEICSLNGNSVLDLPSVYVQSKLPVSRKDVISLDDLQKWPHLSDVPLQRINSSVDLLVGINVPKAMEPWEVIPSVNNGPFAVKTVMGWIINGPLGAKSNSETIAVNFVSATPSLEDQVRNQFNHDFNERIFDDKIEHSKEDKRFIDVMNESSTLKDGHYTIDLPFKSKDIKMPNNRTQAVQRLALLARRLEKDDKFYDEYRSFMDKVIDSGYARRVSPEDLRQDNGRVWYLPHHGVYHPKKKKLRVVFDCAVRFHGTSLNENLMQGPNLTNTLVGTLIRFRQEEVAIMGDIDSMFYQVRVPPHDMSFLRFLWWQNGDTSKQVVEYQMAIHLFGSASSPSCANFALRKTAQDNQGLFKDEVISTVLRNFYVDDCLKSVSTVDDAVSLVHDLKAVLQCGGFNISKWISNNREVMSTIPLSDRAKEVKDLDLDQEALPIERALGVTWCVESDVFCYKVVIRDQPFTRRGILSMISSVYDPLDFLAPLMLEAKGLLQELCKLKIGWDDPIPDIFVSRWSRWLQKVQNLSEFKVNRCFKPYGFGSVRSAQLHHFADASEKGYGTVTYLRLENSEGNVHCSFVIGKSRVAPLKQVTIPRLELTAATVAVRTERMLREELDLMIDRTVFWTDSMSVLRYICNTTSRYHTFVANRLAVIHEGSTPDQWRYVNTKLNPADIASRGLAIDSSLWTKQWISAPEFLWDVEGKWPKSPEVAESIGDDPEVKKVAVRSVITTELSGSDVIDSLISRHSSWFLLKRNVAWILKVRKELLRRVKCNRNQELDNSSVNSEKSRISTSDMSEAEKVILKFVQRQEFASEIDSLRDNKRVKQNSHIRKLDPILDAELLRVGGRLHESSMPAESKHPCILPKNHPVSVLVLRQIHIDLNHAGRNHMLAKLRQKYWIVNAPTAIRKLISKCVACRRQGSRVGEQKMANLPEDRITPDETPFTRVGVDYFGPFEVKQKRCHVKRYGVIFTCLASRAVHLEVAYSLDTDSYINALRRFIARRGQVTKMRSDNGTNFVGAERELQRSISEWNISQIHEAMLQRNIDWQFNPPAGSHHGGVWERLIRSVRKVMNSVLREQTLDDERLQTLMCEIEAILNDRPITKNSDHHNDLEALTPNHLLLMKRNPSLPPGIFSKTDNYSRRRWKQVQFMANLFWQRWVREYLPLLQERQKWHEQKRNMNVGDVVLVVDSNAPRNSWPMGVVLETIPDRRGLVRQVKVKTATNTLIRPIDKLCVILESD